MLKIAGGLVLAAVALAALRFIVLPMLGMALQALSFLMLKRRLRSALKARLDNNKKKGQSNEPPRQ